MQGRKPFFRPRLAFSRDATPAADPPPKGGAALDADQAQRFRALVLPHLDEAYGFARYLTRDATAAEDIVQDAFLKAMRAFPSFRGGSAKAWLFTIVRNGFIDWVQAARRSGRLMVDEAALPEGLALAEVADPDQQTPEAALLSARDAETVRAVVESLPEPFRETLVLREFSDLSYREIAELTGSPIGTVMSRLARARQMLADLLLPRIGDHPGTQEARR